MISNITKILITLLFFIQPLHSPLAAQSAEIKEAEAAYTSENYAEAIELYEGIIKSNGASAVIYYNLGNAYYKNNELAPAILSYERALKLDPSDSDTRFNLEMANLKTVDKIEPLGDFFLTSWFKTIQNLASVDAWAKMAVACFFVCLVGLSFYFFSRRMILKKGGFYLSLAALLCVVLFNIFASAQKDAMMDKSFAIVFLQTVTVKSSPDQSGTDLFVLHEGTKVNIKSTLGEWSEIMLADGNIGWMPTAAIKNI